MRKIIFSNLQFASNDKVDEWMKQLTAYKQERSDMIASLNPMGSEPRKGGHGISVGIGISKSKKNERFDDKNDGIDDNDKSITESESADINEKQFDAAIVYESFGGSALASGRMLV